MSSSAAISVGDADVGADADGDADVGADADIEGDAGSLLPCVVGTTYGVVIPSGANKDCTNSCPNIPGPHGKWSSMPVQNTGINPPSGVTCAPEETPRAATVACLCEYEWLSATGTSAPEIGLLDELTDAVVAPLDVTCNGGNGLPMLDWLEDYADVTCYGPVRTGSAGCDLCKPPGNPYVAFAAFQTCPSSFQVDAGTSGPIDFVPLANGSVEALVLTPEERASGLVELPVIELPSGPLCFSPFDGGVVNDGLKNKDSQ